MAGLAQKAAKEAVKAIIGNPDKSVFPFSLLLLVAGFLGIQNRLDRGDPKLALAPTFADPALEFRPPPGDDYEPARRPTRAGARACSSTEPDGRVGLRRAASAPRGRSRPRRSRRR